MNINNTVTFNISLMYLGQEELSKINDALLPKQFKKRVWLPQSLGDCVWLWYEFDTVEEKNDYLSKLHKTIEGHKLEDILDDIFDQSKLDYWVGDNKHKFVSFDMLTGGVTSHD